MPDYNVPDMLGMRAFGMGKASLSPCRHEQVLVRMLKRRRLQTMSSSSVCRVPFIWMPCYQPACALPNQTSCVLPLQTMWTAELRRRLRDEGRVLAVAVHPGEVLTNVTRSTPAWVQQVYRALWIILLTPSQGEGDAQLEPLVLAEVSALLLPWTLRQIQLHQHSGHAFA